MKLEIKSKSQLRTILRTIRGLKTDKVTEILQNIDLPEKIGYRKLKNI